MLYLLIPIAKEGDALFYMKKRNLLFLLYKHLYFDRWEKMLSFSSLQIMLLKNRGDLIVFSRILALLKFAYMIYRTLYSIKLKKKKRVKRVPYTSPFS
jgi:hypothetical protein